MHVGSGVRALSWGNCARTTSPKARSVRTRSSRLGFPHLIASHRLPVTFRLQPLRWNRGVLRRQGTRASVENAPGDDASEEGRFLECVSEHFMNKTLSCGPPERTLQMYLRSPEARCALLNVAHLERLGDGRFRCFGRKFDAFSILVEPVVTVSIVQVEIPFTEPFADAMLHELWSLGTQGVWAARVP
eukprot:174473-Prorocentrum_minimum.AAC.6